MKISIITACFNSEKTISYSLQSLGKQDYSNIEHLVQDGVSSDRTIDTISSLSPHSLVESTKDSGIFDALNKAMSRSTGHVIGILHADDHFLSDNVISQVMRTFKETGADAVYGDLKYVNRKNPEKVVRTWKSGEYNHGDFLYGWMPPHPAFFIKKEVVEKFGGYDLRFGSAADYEWMLRLIHKHRINLAYVPEFITAMRVGGKSNASFQNRIEANRMDRRAWKANDLQPRWYTLYLKPLRKISQYFS